MVDENSKLRTIYTDFVEYSGCDAGMPSDPKSGMIYALDTNVLLNLFKYTPATARELVNALDRMKAALFVPHQVLQEFWPLLEDVRKGAHHREARGKIQSSMDDIDREVRKWLTRTGLESVHASSDIEAANSGDEPVADRVNEAMRAMRASAESLRETIQDIVDETQDDGWILEILKRVLEGRIGAPQGDEDYEEWMREFECRVNAGLPPGNRDVEVNKGNVRKSSGDYVIWRQCIEEGVQRTKAKDSPIDLTLITNDFKDDWTRSTNPPLARRELVREYADATSGVFRIASFESLINTARISFGAELTESSMAQVAAVETQKSSSVEWNLPAVRRYLNVLWNYNYMDQLGVLLAVYGAAKMGVAPVTFSEARSITGRDSLAAFAMPYRSVLNRGDFAKLDPRGELSAMVWSSDDRERGDGIYDFVEDSANAIAGLDVVVPDDEDFRRIYGQVTDTLRELRGI